MLNLAAQINRRINYLKKYHPPENTSLDPFPREALLKVYADQQDPENVEKATSRYFETAKQAGVKEATVRQFLRYGYVAQPMQLGFHAAARECDLDDGPTQVGCGGARGPGKSHGVFAQVSLDDCQRVRGLKVLYLRRVQKNAREQFEDLRLAVLRHVPHEYKRNEGLIRFRVTGSRVMIGHFNNESDIDKYLGLEYDIIVIEEATTLTLTKYKALRDSNRTSKKGWRPRIYSTTNPGGEGHAWYKALFITPAKTKNETDTRFVPGTVDDNAFLDSGYTKKLEENVGWKLRAYRHGDWDIAIGQYFTNWHYDSHVIRPFPVPIHWPAWASFDYGRTHPTAVYLLREFDGDIYVTGEHVQAKLLPAQHSPLIKDLFLGQGLDVKRVRPFVAGADAFENKGDEHGKTIAQQYESYGIHLERANMNRISRAAELLQRLGDPFGDALVNVPVRPSIKIFSTCTHLIECIPALQHDPHRPEDVLKWDIDEDGNGGDDPYDALGMGLLVKRLVRVKPAVAGGRQAGGFRMV